ncbi:MAG: MiaB/RimO family radical SAM methylthiotransferase, partial [Candidatus Omnitrophica bacterium]|nr:MiaB/RimO family radical SAM methylthiotransferase [Candidatus Omnitrophota bacterium]
CKVNQYDTQSIRERFLSHKFKEVKTGKADTYLINTCTVTQTADSKSREVIRRCVKENPKAKIIVTGCLVKRDSSMVSQIKGVSLIVSKSFFSDGISGFSGHTRAFLKVQDGCNNFCSYCKVPLVRGRSKSRPVTEIVKEAEGLARKGFKEIVLTGICLGAYGRDLKGKPDLAKVISALEKIKGILRLRLSSIEAGDVTDSLIRKLKNSKKLCPHLHIPIQSGDDGILKKMKRRYSRIFYINLIKKIRKNVPSIAITTDCLVGFPGETEKSFSNTLSLIKKITPLKVHIFPYSPRKGTYAAENFKVLVPSHIIKERSERLRAWASLCRKKFIGKFKGKKIPVIFEGLSKINPNYWEGYSHNYIKVFLKSKKALHNRLIDITLQDKHLSLPS